MGLPEINITFKKLAESATGRLGRIVAIILKDTKITGITEIKELDEIPTNLSIDNKDYLEMVFKGAITSNTQNTGFEDIIQPKKVICCIIPTTNTTDGEGGETDQLVQAFNLLESADFNYICMPDADETELQKLNNWVTKLEEDNKVMVIAITGDNPANSESVVNFTTSGVKVKGKTKKYDSGQYSPRLAGLIACTPLTESITYAKLDEIEDIDTISRTESNSKIDNGELLLVKEAGAIRVGRGVTSLVPTEKEDQIFKKIKIVDTRNMIQRDIKNTLIDQYIGKVPNSYTNKSILIVAIKEYLEGLAKQEIIKENQIVEINIDAQKKYLKEQDVNILEFSEQQIKEYDTGTNVFLRIKIGVIDAMEDFDIEVMC